MKKIEKRMIEVETNAYYCDKCGKFITHSESELLAHSKNTKGFEIWLKDKCYLVCNECLDKLEQMRLEFFAELK